VSGTGIIGSIQLITGNPAFTEFLITYNTSVTPVFQLQEFASDTLPVGAQVQAGEAFQFSEPVILFADVCGSVIRFYSGDRSSTIVAEIAHAGLKNVNSVLGINEGSVTGSFQAACANPLSRKPACTQTPVDPCCLAICVPLCPNPCRGSSHHN
jgi:hypothetical protein